MFKEKIIKEMKEVFKEIPFGIEHTLKVLQNAEDINNQQQEIKECIEENFKTYTGKRIAYNRFIF
jgi:hypothetical protein